MDTNPIPSKHSSTLSLIDASQFRDVLGHFCSGITIIAARDQDTLHGLTCQSFFSLSLNPPLVAFSVSKASITYPQIHRIGSAAINILSGDQHEVSRSFSRSGQDKWAGISWTSGPRLGHPVISGVLASVECTIENEVDAGDHVLVIARVVGLEADGSLSPLLYFRGGYHGLQATGGPW